MYFWTAGHFRSNTPRSQQISASLVKPHLSFALRDINRDTVSPCAPKQVMGQRVLGVQVSSKYGT